MDSQTELAQKLLILDFVVSNIFSYDLSKVKSNRGA